MKYLQIIRYKNLLMLAFLQLMIRYGFLKLQHINLALTDFQFIMLVLATLLIAAGGYIINDIFDVETDMENRPNKVLIGTEISESLAYNLYFGTTVLGVLIGFYLSNAIGKSSFAGIFIIIAALLYLYANSLKQLLLIGNIIIALLLSFSVLIIALFDLLPVTYDENKALMGLYFQVLLDYAIFAFVINLLREIVKDLEDIEGDNNQDRNTLPIYLGINKTTKIVFALAVVAVIVLLWYIQHYIFGSRLIFSTIFGLITIVSPLIYFTITIFKSKSKSEFSHLSKVLKWILFFGIVSIAIISFNIKHNAA
jgi:4-hydroxybenzoate polyprenyltransferase